jgi:cyclopropane fatty-acyl-phospholipid synthase-like methyltransferase
VADRDRRVPPLHRAGRQAAGRDPAVHAGPRGAPLLGFDEVFNRMWTFYLCYSEAGFRAGYIDVSQLTLARI